MGRPMADRAMCEMAGLDANTRRYIVVTGCISTPHSTITLSPAHLD
jgi:hypothetical protein